MYEFGEITNWKHTINGTEVMITIPKKSIGDKLEKFSDGKNVVIEMRIDDGRCITSQQRRAIFAVIRDIADHTGHIDDVEYLRKRLMCSFMIEKGEVLESLQHCSIETANNFITYLLELSFEHGFDLKKDTLKLTDNTDLYLYLCIKYRKCACCGIEKSDIHHVDAIGKGRDRNVYNDSEHRKIALCRKHHGEAHQIGWHTFANRNKLYGIKYTS